MLQQVEGETTGVRWETAEWQPGKEQTFASDYRSQIPGALIGPESERGRAIEKSARRQREEQRRRERELLSFQWDTIRLREEEENRRQQMETIQEQEAERCCHHAQVIQQ